MLRITPDKIQAFNTKSGRHFCLFVPVNSNYTFELEPSFDYLSAIIKVFSSVDELNSMVINLGNNTDILIVPTGITERTSVKSTSIDKTNRAIIITCTGSYPDENQLLNYLDTLYTSNPGHQVKHGDHFIKHLTNNLIIANEHTPDRCTFSLNNDNSIHRHYGYARFGELVMAPSGEIAFSNKHRIKSSLLANSVMNLNGRIRIGNNLVAVHELGHEPEVNKILLSNLYTNLSDIKDNPITLNIQDGAIQSVESDNPGSNAKHTLECLFTLDFRYRVITEIGHGFNSSISPYQSNASSNEVYSPKNGGQLHIGIGNMRTGFHIDLIANHTKLINDHNLNLLLLEDFE